MHKVIKSISGFFLDLVETSVIGLSFFLIVYLFFMQPHQVNGQSMVPTFQSGDYLLTDKISYRTGNPQRGDVIVFHAPPEAGCPTGTGCDFIKRILAVPGESVAVHDNHVYVNGQAVEESYIPDDFQTAPGKFISGRTVTMGPDEYFAVGDNRSHSSDSRVWGPVDKSEIVGKAFFRYWPLNQAGQIKRVTY
ncbi:signal peptidase I [Candidatus Woesebacteria bacterium]|nr:signal peptidase I [Candidatus Woesebacteria bacterium]